MIDEKSPSRELEIGMASSTVQTKRPIAVLIDLTRDEESVSDNNDCHDVFDVASQSSEQATSSVSGEQPELLTPKPKRVRRDTRCIKCSVVGDHHSTSCYEYHAALFLADRDAFDAVQRRAEREYRSMYNNSRKRRELYEARMEGKESGSEPPETWKKNFFWVKMMAYIVETRGKGAKVY